MTALSTLSPAIRRYLNEYVTRKRRVALARAAAGALAIFVAWMLLWCGIDRLAHLGRDVRVALLVVGVALAAAPALPTLLALRRRPDWIAAAAEVERHNPTFGQRLITVASRLLGDAGYRGSDEILLRLVRDVDQQASAGRASRLVPLRSAAASCAACAILLLIVGGLLAAPRLRFTQLARRFLDPLADVPAVTTTQLTVLPGDRDVVQSQPVTIDVRAARLGDSPVMLYLNDDGRNWSKVVMPAAGPDRFSFSIASVDRDLRYYVAGGDAQSRTCLIRVLRRPAVALFHIRYTFPAYTRLKPATYANGDGRIEAPIGTKVRLTVTSTEPLQAALLTIGDDRILMSHAGDPKSRQADFVVRSDAKYSLDLISTREVAGSGPPGESIRATPDLPPQVRLARGGDSLRLNPRAIVPVWYEALDDYGLQSLAIAASVNGQAPAQTPVRIWGDSRRQQDVCNFDLATLPLGVGDVVDLTMVALDTAGHSTRSLPLEVVISPRSVDLDAYERTSQVRDAAQLAQSLASELENAVKAEDEARGQKGRDSSRYLSASSRADRSLTAASQTANLLRAALLRATTHSHRPRLSAALAAWIDLAEIESAAADDAFRASGTPGGLTDAQRDRLRTAFDRGRQMQSQLAAVQQGEQASAVLADHENLEAAQKRPAPKDEAGRRRARETIARLRQDIAAEAAQLGLDANARELGDQLKGRIQAEESAVSSAKPVDFPAAAAEWAGQMERDPRQRLGMEARLSAAAQAAAIRSDADLIWARDLQLASRAAAALAAGPRTAGPIPRKSLEAFVVDVAAVSSWRQRDRKQPAADDPLRAAANKARESLLRLAGDSPATTHAGTRPADQRQRGAETLAMEASAAAASHQYARAAELDTALAAKLSAPPRNDAAATSSETIPAAVNGAVQHHEQVVQKEMGAAHRIDDLTREQRQLTRQNASTQPGAIAGEQQTVADRIAQVEEQRSDESAQPTDSLNGRDRAASEVLAAQEQLSSMPQTLAAAEQAAGARRDATARLAAARNAAASAPRDQKQAADRAADEAQRGAADAQARLNDAMQPVSPKTAQAMDERLEPFAPETDSARASILGLLEPALASLEKAIAGNDAVAVDRCATGARQAIEACQRELAGAQDLLMDRDPLAAARWFATAAAQSLALQPPDVSHAKLHQARASAALSRAWDQSIHRAAAERLSAIPSLAAVLEPPAKPAGTGPRQDSKFAAAREWGRLRPQDGPDLNASMHDADPPGFEQSLKLYFEALGKAQEGK